MIEAFFSLQGWWGLALVALGMSPLFLLNVFKRAIKS